MSKRHSPESEAFLAQCFREDKVRQYGEEICTRRWIDKAAHAKYRRFLGTWYSDVPRPYGSIPLKQALEEISKRTGRSLTALKHHWQVMGLPITVMRRVRTRVDVDPASVDACVKLLGSYQPVVEEAKPKGLLTDYARQLLARKGIK